MAEVRYNSDKGATEAERISRRLRNSGGHHADSVVQKGEGPTRTITNTHHSGGQHSSHTPGQPGIEEGTP
jgi:hypothetical protein